MTFHFAKKVLVANWRVIVPCLFLPLCATIQEPSRSAFEWNHKTVNGNYREVCSRVIEAAKCASLSTDVKYHPSTAQGGDDVLEIRAFQIGSRPLYIIEVHPQGRSLTRVSVGVRKESRAAELRASWFKWAENGGHCGPEYTI